MVFPPIPAYLDPPNWNQQPAAGHHQHAIGAAASAGGGDARFPPPPQPRPEGNMAAAASGRPVSMADRARLAKVPQPEPGLNCPRCDSTNTKFCYFNNYSLSQPRHFCKTCRRYWTRGGALRNVPVGGGCRRNKRSKSGSSSKPSAPSVDHHRQTGTVVTGAAAAAASALPSVIPPQHHLPFMPSLHPAADYGAAASIGALGFSGIHPVEPTGFHGGGGGGLGGGLEQQWRQLQQVQQFPFLSGMEPPVGPQSLGTLFPFTRHGITEAGAEGFGAGHLSPPPAGPAVLNWHLAPVKMEEEDAEALNQPKQYLGFTRDNGHYWGGINGAGNAGGGGGGWTDLSAFTSASSCSNIL